MSPSIGMVHPLSLSDRVGTRRAAERPSDRPIPQLEHYLSLNGTGRHHLSRRPSDTRTRTDKRGQEQLRFGIQSNIRRYLCNDRQADGGRGPRHTWSCFEVRPMLLSGLLTSSNIFLGRHSHCNSNIKRYLCHSWIKYAFKQESVVE